MIMQTVPFSKSRLVFSDKTNKPTIHCTDQGIYKVIKNTEASLTCTVDGGNPTGTLHWNCSGAETEYRGHDNTVTKTLVWTATEDVTCTCTSTNVAGSTATVIKTEVLCKYITYVNHTPRKCLRHML